MQIDFKVGWLTADNASNNNTTAVALRKAWEAEGHKWDPAEWRIMCLEHAIHLRAKHFVEDIAPTVSSKVLKKVRDAFKKARSSDGEDLDLEVLNEELGGLEGVDVAEDAGDGDEEEFDVADAVRKALALVTQIRKSSQACAYFCKTCKEVNVPLLQLLLWIQTWWASLYDFLDCMLEMRKAVDRFTRLADGAEEVPVLNGKNYSNFTLTCEDWSRLVLMHEVLREPAEAHQSFSSGAHTTLWRAIPILEYLQESWETMAKAGKFAEIKTSIEAGLANMGKWYTTV
ncbi:hypothetical protein JAAARDRAFT_201236 [Jaapia argillacea MUCL 33604]|uniref:DUF659 domain-containing protein n=1 Tax=Jaapia argillacea MUCL 33604 TaxID=933084 RepID=A0A067P2N0_9AGAM|nr:hypothetical protein JAAARDRAFT_201236 [Jaapia argillacea MUCL 33604]